MNPAEFWADKPKQNYVVFLSARDRRGKIIDTHRRYIRASGAREAERAALLLGIPKCASTALTARSRLMGPEDAHNPGCPETLRPPERLF